MAKRTEIPSNYLSKVLLALRDMGLPTKARGSGVGYRLQKCPKEIHLVNVVTVFDATQIDPPCLLGQKECSNEDPYTAHAAWRDVRLAFIRLRETTTIADMAGPSCPDMREDSKCPLTLLPGGQQR